MCGLGVLTFFYIIKGISANLEKSSVVAYKKQGKRTAISGRSGGRERLCNEGR